LGGQGILFFRDRPKEREREREREYSDPVYIDESKKVRRKRERRIEREEPMVCRVTVRTYNRDTRQILCKYKYTKKEPGIYYSLKSDGLKQAEKKTKRNKKQKNERTNTTTRERKA